MFLHNAYDKWNNIVQFGNIKGKIGHSKGFKDAILALILTKFWTLN